ncbi:hypothetical protein DFH29DRAFT_878417 [Suillus ampliporus]|nr:hypothetical protein DFH29DRAFT_878417 [Suillus ampliporus]
MHKEYISEAVAKLLKTGEYLWLPDSSESSRKAALNFYYNNGTKALKLTDEFQHKIPINSLILVAAVVGFGLNQFLSFITDQCLTDEGVLSSFHDSGTDKVSDLTADTCRADFNTLQKSINKLMDIPKRHVELEEMLREWANEDDR